MRTGKKLIRKKSWLCISMCICLIAGSSFGGFGGIPVQAADKKVKVIGYLPSYRNYYMDSIDYSALTHLNLCFITYGNGMLSCSFSDSDVQRIKEKCRENHVKVMIALGGGGGFDVSEGDPFETPEKRTAMVTELMNYVDRWELDGLDIDIEIDPTDPMWNHFDAFVSELSGRLKAENKLLTIAVASWMAHSISSSTYEYFDFVNLMAYDENAGNGPVASWSYVESMVDYFRGKGISDDRLTIGVPFYGFGPGGWDDAYTYAQILAMNPDAASMDEFDGIYYNGADTIKRKAEYAKNFGGIMIWELAQDADGDASLLKVIKDTLGDMIGDSSDSEEPQKPSEGDSTEEGNSSEGGNTEEGNSSEGGSTEEENPPEGDNTEEGNPPEGDNTEEGNPPEGDSTEEGNSSEDGNSEEEFPPEGDNTEEEFPSNGGNTETGTYAAWVDGISYSIGDLVVYDNKVYECVIAHTASVDWTPDLLNALWKERADLTADSPEKPDKPNDTEKPGELEKPDDTEIPEEQEKPDDTEIPEGQEKPDDTKIPEGQEKPSDTEKPDVSGGTGKPGEQEKPDDTEITDHVAGSIINVQQINISGNIKKLAAGKKMQLNAVVLPYNASNSSLIWSSSNEKYAQVDNNGLVSAKKTEKIRKVTITAAATDGSGVKQSYKLTIMPTAVKKITLQVPSKTVKAGKKVKIKAIITPKTSSNKINKTLQWESSNPKYATVTSKGIVKTKKAGKGKNVKITARATDGSGKSKSVKIFIK